MLARPLKHALGHYDGRRHAVSSSPYVDTADGLCGGFVIGCEQGRRPQPDHMGDHLVSLSEADDVRLQQLHRPRSHDSGHVHNAHSVEHFNRGATGAKHPLLDNFHSLTLRVGGVEDDLGVAHELS